MFTPMNGRAVIVTGASLGIGKGIARVFARAGADLLLTARDAGRLADTARELQHEGPGRVLSFAADVSKPAGCWAIAAAASTAFGRIDVLCANAGVFPSASVARMTEQDVDDVFAVNVKGMIFMVQACLPWLAAKGQGRVVLTSSVTGPITGFPGWAHYGASKAAQLGFLRTAAIELAPQRITVNAVLPGNIATEGLADLGPEYQRGMEAAIPLRRLGTVEDIGHAALFLASAEAGFITGQTIVVDGGQVLPESAAALAGI